MSVKVGAVAVNRIELAIKRLIGLPNDLLFFLTGDGDWKLRFPTQEIIDFLLTSLPPADVDMIRRQLAQPFVQHWWHKGRVNPIFYYALDPETLLKGEAYQDGMFRVEMFVDGKKQRAHVTFVAGRLYSVELPKALKFYQGKTIAFGAVTRGRSNQSLTQTMDRLEHGSERDD